MELWQVRNQALAALSNELKQENELLERCFALFDESIKRFYSLESSEDSNERFALICGQTMVKARRLALVSVDLAYDSKMLKTNMRSLFNLMLFIETIAANCLLVIDQFDNMLRKKIILLQEDGFRTFETSIE